MKKKWFKKRYLVIIPVILGLIGLTMSLTTGGSSQQEVLAQENQSVAVQRGDLSLEITAAGNLALSRTEDLAVDLFYQEGTIEEVLVEAGDTVEEGQVLARLDTDEWNDELNSLEDALATAQRNLNSRERALTTAERLVDTKERAVTTAERQVDAKELAVRQAELNAESAQNNLYDIEEVRDAKDDVDDAELALKVAIMGNTGAIAGLSNDYAYWTQLVNDARDQLEEAQEELQNVLAGTSTSITSSTNAEDVILAINNKMLAVEQAQMNLEDAKIAVEDAERAVDDAKYSLEGAQVDVEDAKLDVEEAKEALEKAQSDLDEANSLSPVITAPFAGFITKVNVEGGDEVLKGTVVAQIADPNMFESEILVSELDISKVELEGEASVKASATGVSLPAIVTQIAPTATISSGVVNYSVTVEVESVPEDVNLKEGMTVTVSLIVSKAENVLLVPYSAVITENGQKYVQVVSADGSTEMRQVTTGDTDYQYTEISEGLSEGEQVLASGIVISTTSTEEESTDEQQGPPDSGMMIPGVTGGGPPAGGPRGGG